MTLKTTQRELKRKFRKEIQDLKYAIFGECYSCQGFFADGYYDCGTKDCSLYGYRLKHPKNRWSKNLALFLREVKRQIQQK